MVFKKIKEILKENDDKYLNLYHSYSKLKLDNKNLIENHIKELEDYKIKIYKKAAIEFVEFYNKFEKTINSSFSVTPKDEKEKEFLINLSISNKKCNELLEKFLIKTYLPKERYFDKELHDLDSYQKADEKMEKGIILKTTKKGIKIRGEVYKKPKVIVTN